MLLFDVSICSGLFCLFVRLSVCSFVDASLIGNEECRLAFVAVQSHLLTCLSLAQHSFAVDAYSFHFSVQSGATGAF